MKNIKWVLLILSVLTVTAVLVNYDRLFPSHEESAETDYGDAEFVYDETSPVTEYFTAAKYNRDRKRSESISALTELLENEDTDSGTRQTLYEEIASFAFSKNCESDIENLISAKGFGDCIAFVGKEGVSIVVEKKGLTPADAAKIMDIAARSSGFSAADITVIEYSAGEQTTSESENISE